jgi:hypothetical protein
MEATVSFSFDPVTSQITIAGIQSRMSLDEADALAGELARVVAASRPK